jgi:hypothetical protein
MKDDRFYVYVLLDPRKPGNYTYGPLKFDHEPFYVGKGCGGRKNVHSSNCVYNKWKARKIKAMEALELQYGIKIVANDKQEDSAFSLEGKAIKLIGRKGQGPLVNLTDGGEGTSGRLTSNETKKLHTENNKKRWAAMSRKERKLVGEAISEGAARRSPDERAKLTLKFRAAQHSIPDAKQLKKNKKVSRGLKRHRAQMTDKQKAEESVRQSAAVQNTWNNIDSTERSRRANKSVETMRQTGVLEKRNAKTSATISQQHAAMSDRDKVIRKYNIMVGMMVSNAVKSGDLSEEKSVNLKDGLLERGQKFYTEDRLTVPPQKLKERVRKIIYVSNI